MAQIHIIDSWRSTYFRLFPPLRKCCDNQIRIQKIKPELINHEDLFLFSFVTCIAIYDLICISMLCRYGMIVKLIQSATDMEVVSTLQICLNQHFVTRKTAVGLTYPVWTRDRSSDGGGHLFTLFVGLPV